MAYPAKHSDVILGPVQRICDVPILLACLDPWDKPKDDALAFSALHHSIWWRRVSSISGAWRHVRNATRITITRVFRHATARRRASARM